MQLFESLCATFLHTMPHLFPPAVSIVAGTRYFDAVALIFLRLLYIQIAIRKYSFCKIFTIANCWYSQHGRQEVDYQL